MAKALLGYINSTDPRAVAHLAAENRRLRQRVEDLEAHVLRLQAQNDALAAAADRELLTVPDEMQLA
jgi:cell division protein FtsB